MSSEDSRAKLVDAAKKLMADWAQVKEIWRDENGRRFEKKVIEALDLEVRTSTLAMEHIGAAVRHVRQDCALREEGGL